jgi:hypothetical protein
LKKEDLNRSISSPEDPFVGDGFSSVTEGETGQEECTRGFSSMTRDGAS